VSNDVTNKHTIRFQVLLTVKQIITGAEGKEERKQKNYIVLFLYSRFNVLLMKKFSSLPLFFLTSFFVCIFFIHHRHLEQKSESERRMLFDKKNCNNDKNNNFFIRENIYHLRVEEIER
jgi:hypothetical protein